ncbi:hypothetical protein [Flavobacterium sp.]|uniref:hypothetical protein n=1 Tax=Flavobacterium sp. TaxID=239 RepID=UPI0025B8301D|nr:hypothetical protein [Flavobacterium sp.]MBA4276833.1 hypothetical protein [Flavobacterium sp.]
MKYINFTVIVVILMLGCASRSDKSRVVSTNPIGKINDTLSEKYAVVSDFLDTKIKDRSKKIMIHSRKINTNMTLKILRLNEIYALDSIDSKKNYEDKTFYKEADWEIARKKYSKNSVTEIENATDSGGECCWVAENFNYKNVIFEELQPGSKAFIEKYIPSKITPFEKNLDCTTHYEFYLFSEPIYYQNRECLIFTFSKGDLSGLSGSSNIIIYKKKNGKWVQTHIGMPNWFS